MSHTNGPTGSTDGSSGTAGPPGAAAPAAPVPHQPPRWAWWVAGIAVPLTGVVATLAIGAQRSGPAVPVPSAAPPGAVAPPVPSAPVTSASPSGPAGTPSATAPPSTSTPPAPPRTPVPSPRTSAPPREPSAPGITVAPPAERPVRLVNHHSGLCLAVPGAATGVVGLNQFGCGPYPDHLWRLMPSGRDAAGRPLHRIVNGNSGLCAAVPAGSRKAAAEVDQYPCGAYLDHLWRFAYERGDTAGRPLFRVVNGNSGMCLAVPGGSRRETAPVNQFPCGPYDDHLWRVVPG
ncbi:RICIN domain-containing protein [Streptomyces sp. NPDC101490]|uniref:RICIN domain-containing protein n=1 Tax=Streptomyces sp. NPDC101490 TaxID=3366143 RepID=UPI0038035A2A